MERFRDLMKFDKNIEAGNHVTNVHQRVS